jgi:hypothetical protein
MASALDVLGVNVATPRCWRPAFWPVLAAFRPGDRSRSSRRNFERGVKIRGKDCVFGNE